MIFMLSCSQPTTFDRNNVNDYFSDNYVPNQPSELKAEILGESEIKLEWKHENSDSVRFEIQRSKDKGPFETVTTTNPGETELCDTFLLDLQSSYKYRISSVKDTTKSSFTEAESITFELQPPVGLLISGAEESFALLEWESGNSFETNYNIQIREIPSNTYNVLTNDHRERRYTLENFSPDRSYEIRVAATTSHYISDHVEKEILYTVGPREVRRIDNNFSRDAAYLGDVDSRKIVNGTGSHDWFIRNSPTQEHVIKSRYGNEITLIDSNQNHITNFVIDYGGTPTPPHIPPLVQVSSKWELIITHGSDNDDSYYFFGQYGVHNLRLYNFQGDLVKESEPFGEFLDLKISRDEEYVIAHYVKPSSVSRKRDSYFKVWTLPDLVELEDFQITKESQLASPLGSPPYITDFAISSQNNLIAAKLRHGFGLHLYSFTPEMGIEYRELIDFDIPTSIKSLIFSDQDRFLFIEYYTPDEDSNFMVIDLENSNQSEKFKLGEHDSVGKLQSFYGSTLFMTILSHYITEFTYQNYWFFK